MTLDADIRAHLDSIAGVPSPSQQTMSIPEMRAATHQLWLAGPGPEKRAQVAELLAPGSDADVPLRLYRAPGTASSLPLVVFMHGGGFVFGSLDTHSEICHRLALDADCAVLSVGYRLAPEHPFPAAVNDCWAALQWAVRNASELGVDPERIVLLGDSAGGNLAAVTALQALQHGVTLAGQALIYPVTDLREVEYESRVQRAHGFGLSEADMRWYGRHYLQDAAAAENPLASPILAPSLSGLPDTFLMTAGHDPLCSEGEAYGLRLLEEGVTVSHLHLPGANHGVFSNWKMFESGEATWQALLSWLGPVLHSG